MYSTRSNLILGFHGCDGKDQMNLINDPNAFKISKEDYDWLGHGMYFWENNYKRSIEWAQLKLKSGNIKSPASIGAVIDLGYCLDLLDSKSIGILNRYYSILKHKANIEGLSLPKNRNHPKVPGNEKTLRFLDCAVIEFIHSEIENAGEKAFDSVRALFIEGNQIYPDAGFYDKTHIQICIRNPNCIKGLFLPRGKNKKYPSV